MKKILIFVSIIMIILLMLSSKKDYYVIPDESIRFRIIANSNSTNDQYIKIKVKDVLEKEVTNDLKTSNTIETSRIIIEKNMDKYKNKVKETLEDLNYNTTFTINFGDNYFPKKEYKDVIYEEGNYESLVVTLGNGEGDNWWCVLFPPICTLEVEENKEAEAEVVEEEKVDQEDQIKILQGEVDKWKNDYYKVFADMENIKRRMQNEHANNLKFMMQGFIEQMLPIVDNFERSLAIENPSEEVANFLKGYEMIYKQIMTLLENQGVKVIEAEGKEFDPNFHQAVMTVSDENFKPGMVVEELQKGYMLKDRVIRASLVKVSE